MHSFALWFAIVWASTLCLTNGQVDVDPTPDPMTIEIKYDDQPVVGKYEGVMPDNEDKKFQCQIKGGWPNYLKTTIKWYIEEEEIYSQKGGQGLGFATQNGGETTSKLDYEIQGKHYKK